MDADIARIHSEQQIDRLKSGFVMELLRLRLHACGPMTITEVAESVHRTHAALSQKVAAMRTADWVQTAWTAWTAGSSICSRSAGKPCVRSSLHSRPSSS